MDFDLVIIGGGPAGATLARLLAEVLTAAPADLHQAYRRATGCLRRKIAAKLLKSPFMYRPTLRHLVMRSGLLTIDVIDG